MKYKSADEVVDALQAGEIDVMTAAVFTQMFLAQKIDQLDRRLTALEKKVARDGR